jgi:hypothetical protein
MTDTTEGNGTELPPGEKPKPKKVDRTNAERQRRFKQKRKEAALQAGAEREAALSRLLVNMAGAILRAPLTVDEKAAALSWAAVQFMRARKDAINRGG